VRYLATLLIVSTMLALGLALDEHFHGFPFLLFSFAILISSALSIAAAVPSLSC